MRSFASALLLLSLLAPALVAQEPAIPAAVTAVVADSLARRWDVPASRVVIEWGRASAAPPATAPVRLLGRGDDGMLVAVFEGGDAPLAVRLRAGTIDSVAVAARDLASGTTLTRGDITRAARSSWGPPSRDDQAPAAGWITRRPVRQGDALAQPAVAPPVLVEAGAPVRLEWQRGAVAIEMNGVAQGAASLGETIHVRVPGRTGQRTATVTGPGLARLDR